MPNTASWMLGASAAGGFSAMLARTASEYGGLRRGPRGSVVLIPEYSATTQDPPGDDVVHGKVAATSVPVATRYRAARLSEVPTLWQASFHPAGTLNFPADP